MSDVFLSNIDWRAVPKPQGKSRDYLAPVPLSRYRVGLWHLWLGVADVIAISRSLQAHILHYETVLPAQATGAKK
jgi:hypothetical protein